MVDVVQYHWEIFLIAVKDVDKTLRLARKNKSYYMNFKHKKNELYVCLYNLYNKFKVHVRVL